MYRMYNRKKNIRIFVRNKARYNPETKERDFLFVDINDFAGTTIGDIKENVRRQCRNTVKIDELFLNNVSLADDRSVAHYNLEDGSILESTSNPLWVSCLYIKALEVRQQQEGNPCDEEVQKWTSKSLPKKYTLIGVLLNSNNAYQSQPPHFSTLQDFVQYLERLGRKGATMHPNYTGRDMAIMEQEFERDFEKKFNDPIAAFIDHHAVRLGILNPDEAERKLRQPTSDNGYPVNSGASQAGTRGREPANSSSTNGRFPANVPSNAGRVPAQGIRGREPTNVPGHSGAVIPNRGRPMPDGVPAGNRNTKKQIQVCEDCEMSLAVIYCTDCQNATDGVGVSLCKGCSDLLHTGATRRRHNLIDISQAPKTAGSKPYVPRAFLAPFSILLAMYSALLDRTPKLSLTEEEIKIRAQSLTDTDLQDKQAGKYVGGFDCMENCLMNKGLVKKEAAREPTYALTDLGNTLGEKLYLFYRTLFTYLSSCQLPKLPDAVNTTCVGNRKICLLIDENEREKGRLLKFAADKGIDAQTRFLPAGDYIWILTPPMVDTGQQYTGNHTDTEIVLPFIVERKSWEDFEHSVNSTRFQRQGSGVKNCFYLMEGSPGALRYNATQLHQQHLKGSGVKNCFYLMEGSPGALRYNATQLHQQHLKAMVEKLIYDYSFYVNYTSSWMKSAQWLLWLTQLIVEAFKQGKLRDDTIPYREYSSRVAQLNGAHPPDLLTNRGRKTHNWPAQIFVDQIFRDALGDRTLLRTVQEDLGIQGREQHLLVIQGLEQYNKKRQAMLNKCCTEVHNAPHLAKETVERLIGADIHNMVHYDITCYKQLYIQVMTGVYILRTESDGESDRVQGQFLSGPQPIPHQPGRNKASKNQGRKPKSPRINSPHSREATAPVHTTTPFHGNSKITHPLDINALLHITDREDSHTLPPGCSVSSNVTSRKRLSEISRSSEIPRLSEIPRSSEMPRSELPHSVKPFSGSGFTLGSGNPSRSRPTATVTIEHQIQDLDNRCYGDRSRSVGVTRKDAHLIDNLAQELNNSCHGNRSRLATRVTWKDTNLIDNLTQQLDNSCHGNRSRSAGVTRKDANLIDNHSVEDRTLVSPYSASSTATDGRSAHNTGDYIDIQNEDHILQEVIQKSRHDAPSVDTDSQDDPELQLVLMLSKETDQVNPVSNITKPVKGSQGIDKSVVDITDVDNNISGESQEELDEQMRLAIERSKLDSGHTRMIDNKTWDGLHRSSNSGVHFPDVSPDISVNDSIGMKTLPEDEDEQLSLAISMSKVIKTPETPNQEMLDIQMQEAIELSKSISTPKKSNQELLDIQMQEAIELSKSISTPKTSNEDVLGIQMQEAIKLSKSINTPENSNQELLDIHMQEAIELSKSISTPKDSNQELLDIQMQEAIKLSKSISTPKKSNEVVLESQMQEVIERSKLDHTPQKVVDADYQLKLAIERSKIENSPKITDSELEQKILKVAIEKSIAEQSPVSSPRKRKHNLIDECNVSRKILRTFEKKCFGGRDKFEAASTDNDSVINLCDSQNSIIQGGEMAGSNEDVIQIDSQSQDINSDEELKTPEKPKHVKSWDMTNDTLSLTGENRNKEPMNSASNMDSGEELETQEKAKHVKSWDMTNDTLCLTGENRNKEPMNSVSNVDSDAYDSMEEDEVDLIPPSPSNDSLNSSQISVSFNSFTSKSNTSSVLSSESMRYSGDSKNINLDSSSQLQEPNSKLCDSFTSTCEGTEDFCVPQKSSVLSQVSAKVTNPQKSSELSQESSKVTNRQTSPELSDLCTTVANLPESNNSDSSKLKSSLLRLVDENASDDDSFSESDSEDDNDVEHNKSHDDSTGSVADILQGDKTDDRIINMPSKDINSNEVPKLSETVSNLSSSLVSLSTEHCLQARYSKYTSKTTMPSDLKMAKSEFHDSSVSETCVNTVASDLQSFIKVEPVDEGMITSPPLNPCETVKKKIVENSKFISDVVVKSESKEQNESLVYSQKDSSEYYGFDSDMDEVNFNPDLDDSDADPSFQPGKASSTESCISDDNDDDDNMDELISKIDPDYLPSISRPKKRRKCQQKDTTCRKKTSDSSDSKSKNKRHANNDIVVKVEKSESPAVDTGMDAMLAQMLQRELNREAEHLASVNSKGSNSAHLAGRMQGHSLSPSDAVETDEELARRLDAELNNDNSSSGYEHHKARDSAGVLQRSSSSDSVCKTVLPLRLASDSVCQTKSDTEPRGNKHLGHLGVEDIVGTDILVKELQRRELEKIQRMQKFLEDDKKLAEKLQENYTENDEGEISSNPVPRNYTKLIADDRALREKAAAKLEEYRKLQSQRYHPSHSQKSHGDERFGVTPTDNWTANTRTATEKDRFFKSSTFDKQTSIPFAASSSQINHIQSQNSNSTFSRSQRGPLTPCINFNQSNDGGLGINQSQTISHTQSSQSKPPAERNLNTTCGNCGEKGHTRVNPNCPKYHTADESARREAQQERKRQQREEKKREEEENINMLARHQQVIEEMNNELQREISTLQNNLRTRAVELESQVNSRVKKMENAEKRKKKK